VSVVIIGQISHISAPNYREVHNNRTIVGDDARLWEMMLNCV